MVALKALIIVMGALILAGVAIIGVTLVNRASEPRKGQAAAPGFVAKALNVGPGCAVAETRLDGGRLVVRTEGPAGCRRIHILDLGTGEALGVIDMLPAQ